MTDQVDAQAAAGRAPISDRRPTLPGYSLGRKLAESEDAVTWKSVQLSLDRAVVVKVLKPALLRDAERCRRFIEQTRAVAQLKHPAVIQVYDVERRDDACYVVTEYIDGESLDAALQRGGAQPLRTTLYTVRSLAELLDEAWTSLGIAHGGIHPRNIMYDRDGSVKLADLGMTGVGGAASGRERDLSYQAPECDAPGAEPTCRSDMYALGAVMYHMLTGHKPFEGLTRDADGRIQRGELASPRDVDPALPTGAIQLLRRLMMREPADRYPDWAAVIKDMRKVESGKMLVVKSRQPGDGPSGKMAKAKVAVPTSGAGAPLRLRPRPTGTPAPAPRPPRYAGLRVVLWLLLFAWWGGLTWYLLELPPRLELRRPAHTASPRPARPEAPAAVDRAPSPAPAPVPPRQPSASVAPEAAQPAVPPVQSAREAGVPGREALDPVAAALIDEDTDAARQRLRALRARYDSAAASRLLDEVEAIVEAVEGMESAVLAAFNRQRGERLDIDFGGRRQTVIVRGVEGGAVRVDTVTGRADSPVLTPQRIPISLLGPDERLRLLGAPSTAADAAIHFLLRMEDGDFQAAREQAAACGPLAPAFADAVDRRIQVLMQ